MSDLMHMRHRRRGMTLVEIMISLVLLGIVSGVLMRVILRQQRFYTGVNQIMTQRGQLRQATSVLPVDLRSLSSVGADIMTASDSSIEFNVNIGTGVVCALTGGAGKHVVLPALSLATEKTTGNTFTTLYGYSDLSLDLIQKGVTVFIYNDSSTVGNEDDRWQQFDLDVATPSTSLCLTHPWGTIADIGKRRFVLQLSDPDGRTDPVTTGPISQWIGVGAPVRLVKHVKYKLYQASDGQWYLGFAEYDKSVSGWGDLTPVSGPYEPYSTSSGTPTGVGFKYYNVDDVEVPSGSNAALRATIARIDLIARARTSANVRAAGIQGGADQQYRDSLAVSVMLRNRQ